ncbi:MAG: hypothetical protein ACKOX6_18230 [Bdellovibrio sp.]
MAYKIQSSFSAGELDPALHERTTFDKYKSGLATLRNAFIGKTGRVISRCGKYFVKSAKLANKRAVLFHPPYSGYMIEWGHLYVRIHNITLGTFVEEAHDWTEDDLDYIQFEPSGYFVYLFRFGKKTKKMVLGDLVPGTDRVYRFVDPDFVYYYPTGYAVPTLQGSTATGHLVEYVTTIVSAKGEESMPSVTLSGASCKMPINTGEQNYIYVQIGTTSSFNEETKPLEMRIYRRPAGGNAFGYVGSTSVAFETSGFLRFEFKDYGVTADYTHSPPSKIAQISDPAYAGSPYMFGPYRGPIYAYGRTGLVYQQRLLISEQVNEEAIHTSRTGFQTNFSRDYPYSADSALSFKAGTSGNAKVLRMVDYNGLLAFTTVGIYTNQGPLSPDNIAMSHKGNWVIDETIPPLKVPGGLLFVDKTTNVVRNLSYSNEAGGFPGEELSIFSNHLFENRKIRSWAFQDGDVPLIWVVFDDGALVSLTFLREHQMQAWARHDTDGTYESVTVVQTLAGKSTAYFTVKRGNARYIEKTADRFVKDIKDFVCMDSAVTFKTQVNPAATLTLTPVSFGDWSGNLTLSASAASFTNTAGNGAPGSIFRVFDEDGTSYDLAVVTYIGTTTVVVETSGDPFPSTMNTGFKLYKTFVTLTGLSHLEGKAVSVLSDGYVVASPNNNEEGYETLIVTGGQITLPQENRGAIVHVGLPFTSDVETLDIDTVEQKPTLLESSIITRLYLKVYKTRGLFLGQTFPKNDKVAGMTNPEEMTGDLFGDVLGNRAPELITKRYELAIPNDWESHGRVCVRQVDPYPFELLSIIPDLHISK